MIRSHWMVENGLHWVLDMIFRDDECRVRTDNAPFNLAIVKHIALNVLRTGKSKDSLRMRRKVAAWDEIALAADIGASPVQSIPRGHIFSVVLKLLPRPSAA